MKTNKILIPLTELEKEFIELISDDNPRGENCKTKIARNLMFYGFIWANHYKYIDNEGGLSRLKELTNNGDFERELKTFINKLKLIKKQTSERGERDDDKT